MPEATKIRNTTFTMVSDNEIVAAREVNAPRQLVWEVSTDPRHVPQWMLGPDGWTMPICEADLRPGGSWHFVWRGPEGADMEMHGKFREVSPPERLVQTENWGKPWPETLNTLSLKEERGKTVITSRVVYPTKEAREAAMATNLLEVWARSYDRLEGYLRALEQGAHEHAQ